MAAIVAGYGGRWEGEKGRGRWEGRASIIKLAVNSLPSMHTHNAGQCTAGQGEPHQLIAFLTPSLPAAEW